MKQHPSLFAWKLTQKDDINTCFTFPCKQMGGCFNKACYSMNLNINPPHRRGLHCTLHAGRRTNMRYVVWPFFVSPHLTVHAGEDAWHPYTNPHNSHGDNKDFLRQVQRKLSLHLPSVQIFDLCQYKLCSSCIVISSFSKPHSLHSENEHAVALEMSTSQYRQIMCFDNSDQLWFVTAGPSDVLLLLWMLKS